MANIYIYSDESGTFDYKHCEYFVYGGVVFLNKEERDLAIREYLSLERNIRKYELNNEKGEIKASKISNRSKRRLLGVHRRCECFPFSIVIHSPNLKQKENISNNSKTKQRYLDWAYKMGVKKVLLELIHKKKINPDDENSLFFFMDEHQSATDGKYELRESLDMEFNLGTYNYDWNVFYGPLFSKHKAQIQCEFCDSKTNVMVRFADIISNYSWHKALDGKISDCASEGFTVKMLP